jgi:hypothetical protein
MQWASSNETSAPFAREIVGSTRISWVSHRMICDVCHGEMKVGIAINTATGELGLGGPAPIANHENIGFIHVMKCVDCGRSLSRDEINGLRR